MSIYDTKEYKEEHKRRVHYEWWIEHVDEFGDIQDCYETKLDRWGFEQENMQEKVIRLCLRRLAGSRANGIDEIGYAYFVDGELEQEFCTGHKVPARYLMQAEAIK